MMDSADDDLNDSILQEVDENDAILQEFKDKYG